MKNALWRLETLPQLPSPSPNSQLFRFITSESSIDPAPPSQQSLPSSARGMHRHPTDRFNRPIVVIRSRFLSNSAVASESVPKSSKEQAAARIAELKNQILGMYELGRLYIADLHEEHLWLSAELGSRFPHLDDHASHSNNLANGSSNGKGKQRAMDPREGRVLQLALLADLQGLGIRELVRPSLLCPCYEDFDAPLTS